MTKQELFNQLEGVLKDNQALVAITDGSVGVATRNERGYNALNIKPTDRYEETSEMVCQVNKMLFPNRSNIETARIVLSSMR